MCGEFFHEERLLRALEAAKEWHMRQKPRRKDSFFARAVRSFRRSASFVSGRQAPRVVAGVDTTIEEVDMDDLGGAAPSLEPKREEKRVRNKERQVVQLDHQSKQSAKSGEPRTESLVNAIMARDEKYAVYTFEFESIDAEEMTRNATGHLLRKVRSFVGRLQRAIIIITQLHALAGCDEDISPQSSTYSSHLSTERIFILCE